MDTDRMVSVQKVFGSMLCCFGAMLLRRRPRFRRFPCESDDPSLLHSIANSTLSLLLF